MIEEYGDLISKIESAVTDTVTEADVSVAGYEAVKAAAMEQAGCFEDVSQKIHLQVNIHFLKYFRIRVEYKIIFNEFLVLLKKI